ncbi:GNAT family N-acetyltransferase [Alphaproteobacteria bacterium]|nr:GNAT family N-acetyltransferase [Alphaproteobacteria bacterium]
MELLFSDERFEIRLTRDEADIDAAQKLRYSVFYQEMGALPSEKMKLQNKDFDEFDKICDHMIVLDLNRDPNDQVVGSYRMLRHEVAITNNGYYSAGEYNISNLLDNLENHKACEIGRSCVHPDYRNNQTIQLLWRGLAKYYSKFKLTRIFGCASFQGNDPKKLSLPLSYLYHYHLAPEKMIVKALDEKYEQMNLMPKSDIDLRKAIKQVPPLIRAYLRLGGVCGDGAVIDNQFNTTDVFLVLAMEDVPEKYHDYFER